MANFLVKIRPSVLFSIVDSHERRNESALRVIGTLLGIVEKGGVEITNCYIVPHNEVNDEVAVDIVFAKEMFDSHKKVNTNEVIVGWYATGPEVTPYSIPVHEYYSREIPNPVHLTLDTSLTQGRMSYKVYTSHPVGVPNKTLGNMFSPCKVEVINTAPEQVGLYVCQQTISNQRPVRFETDLDQIYSATKKTIGYIDTTLAYVDDVLSGKIPADNDKGRMLMELIQSVPKMNKEQFDEMFNANIKDLLMVTYLSQVLEAQLGIHERISLFVDK